jgi:hypothetical protein
VKGIGPAASIDVNARVGWRVVGEGSGAGRRRTHGDGQPYGQTGQGCHRGHEDEQGPAKHLLVFLVRALSDERF